MVQIRPYRPADRAAVRKIFQDTAFHGASFKSFFDHGEWLADFMTAGYLDVDAKEVFVADDEGRVVGYAMGTLDSSAYRSSWTKRVLPKILFDFFTRGVWMSRRNLVFFFNGMMSGLKREEVFPPGLDRDFPAHFHINIDAAYRNQGLGNKLAAAFMYRLRAASVPGVHVRTASKERRQAFFESVGFQPLLISELTLWKYLDQPPHYLITYGYSLEKGRSHHG